MLNQVSDSVVHHYFDHIFMGIVLPWRVHQEEHYTFYFY